MRSTCGGLIMRSVVMFVNPNVKCSVVCMVRVPYLLSLGLMWRLTLCLFMCVSQSGLIRTSEEEYFISPLPQHLAARHNYSAPRGHHAHVIYKRSAEGHVHGDGTSRPVNPYFHHGRRQRRHHHDHRHHDYQHGKLQRQHFCGRRKQCM